MVASLRVVVSGVVKVVTDAGCDEDSHVLDGQPVYQATHVYEAIHHLSDAEAVTEVVERIVSIVLLYAQLSTQTHTCAEQVPSGDLLYSLHYLLIIIKTYSWFIN